MAEMIMDITSAEKIGATVVQLIGEADGVPFKRTLLLSEVETPEKLAAWLLSQDWVAAQNVATLEGRFSVQYHVESVSDNGDFADVPVVDSVTPL